MGRAGGNALRWVAQGLVVVTAALGAARSLADTIVTGGKTGTYYAIGQNLKEIVAPSLEVKESGGSWENVLELSGTKGVSLAIVQSDVYSAFVRLRDAPDMPKDTRKEYAALLANLRVLMPLYQEEIHFLVRKDDPMESISQIRDKRIWMDTDKSGTYLTALNIYSKLFGERPTIVEPFVNPSAIGDDEGTRRRRSALMALSDPSFYKAYPRIDVVVLVGGQPLKLLEKAVPANLKLLRFDPSQPNATRVLQEYKRADIRQASYPLLNIVGTGVPTLSVDSYMITANFASAQRNQFISDFAGEFCAKFGELQSRGHVKWKALSWQPGSPLPPLNAGWLYSDRAKSQLTRCRPQVPADAAGRVCSPQDRFAGLCT